MRKQFLTGRKSFLAKYLFNYQILRRTESLHVFIFNLCYHILVHVFKGLHLAKQVNCKIDPVHTWYPALWKQKAMYHFYEVYNSFVSSFKKLIFGSGTSRLSLEVTTFLDKRGSFKAMDHYNIVRIYCSRERPFYLPYYVPDKIFVIEVCKQYRLWAHFFHERRKKQFIPLPWKIGEIILKNVANIDEYAVQFDQFDLKVAEEIKGFDPKSIFHETYDLCGLQCLI
jgi:hypothetical protein